ncbi:hypothetical protein DFH06DRAFT_1463521 [Mycena polygramma]|nr:hypothetical protein DFH06DRAFT_1463521 [Mycena polygramma]
MCRPHLFQLQGHAARGRLLEIRRECRTQSPCAARPRIRHRPHNPLRAPFILLSRLLGINLLNTAYNSDPALWEAFHYEVFIPELAVASAQLFDAALPPQTQIGELVGLHPDGSPLIAPFAECEPFAAAPSTFSTAEEYILYLISSKKCPPPADVPPTDSPHLTDTHLLSVRAVHIDPHDRNVLEEDSHFSGLVDWKIHTPHRSTPHTDPHPTQIHTLT